MGRRYYTSKSIDRNVEQKYERFVGVERSGLYFKHDGLILTTAELARAPGTCFQKSSAVRLVSYFVKIVD